VIEPVEYILDGEENYSFQLMPVIQTIQHLLYNEHIVNCIPTKHSLSPTFDASSYDTNGCV